MYKIIEYKNFTNLILEAKIEFFKTFKNILKTMSSEVARKILSIEGEEMDMLINYIDISDVDDTISFIPDNRVSKDDIKYMITNSGLTYNTLYKLFKHEGMSETRLRPLRNGTIGNVIKTYGEPELRKIIGIYNGDISYFVSDTGEKCFISTNGLERIVIPKSKKQSMKVGRLATKISQLTDSKFTHKDIENFVNEFKSKIAILNNRFNLIEFISGEDIKKWYNESNYDNSKRGTLQQSCMRYSKCSTFFKIYIQNPEICQLIILKSEKDPSKITSRAILWTLDDGSKFLDRVYYSQDLECELFWDMASKNGWLFKRGNMIFFSDHGQLIKIDKEIKVNLKISKFDKYPYMDTLKYLDIDEKTLSSKNGTYKLEFTDGNHEEPECRRCDGRGRVNCPECDGSGGWECGNCDGEGELSCDNCDGGYEDCFGCDGKGKLTSDNGEESDCQDCNGSGKVECEACGGKEKIVCSRCRGDGKVECDYCYGGGTVDCPECQ